MTETKEERDPRCLVIRCKLDGRNCDPSKCNLVVGQPAENPLPAKGKILWDECGGCHG